MQTDHALLPTLTALLLGACVAAPPQEAAPDTFVVQTQEQARTLNLNIGQPLLLRFSANPSTGFAWGLVTPSQLLVADGKPAFEPNASAPGTVGAPGFETWKFRAVKAGTETLRFEYRRSWENAERPAQIATYYVNVH